MKLIFKENELKQLVLPSIDSTIGSVNNAINVCTSFNYPDDCDVRNTLNKVTEDLVTNKNNLTKVENFINASANRFNVCVSANEKDINSIKDIMIYKRNMITKG